MSNDEHPIYMEITSLKAAVARFQDEAHSASVKLQRYSLDTSNAHDRIIHLERENALLSTEIDVLRRNVSADPQQADQSSQIQELTLSLRRLSEKLDLSDESYLIQTTQLAQANAELDKTRLTLDGAYALAARVRGREEEGLVREKVLEQQVRQAQEQAKLSDMAVREYADLVRSLEGRTSSSSSPTNTLAEGKQALEKLFLDFSEETGRLRAEIARLQHEAEVSRAEREAEVLNYDHVRTEVGRLQAELQKLRLEDNSAAKMVSRYMKFSQASTNALQESLVTLKTRHAATVDTLGTQISELSSQLQQSRALAEKMRLALDELGGDLMREAFGRRRETALRIRMVSREEGLEEWLQRWIRRAEEGSDLSRMLEEARSLDVTTLKGSEERIAVVENALQALVDDLRTQTDRRLQLEKLVILPTPNVPELPTPPLVAHYDASVSATPSESSLTSTLFLSDPGIAPRDEETTDLKMKEDHAAPDVAITPEEISPSPATLTESATYQFGFPAVEDSPYPHITISTEVSPPASLPPTPVKSYADVLVALKDASRRYDTIQRAFKDCHAALQDLKSNVQSGDPILQAAAERLNDFTEDARVELEIRIADEALQTQGFETLISIGGVTEEVEEQIKAFVSGEDAKVRRARKSLEQKLEDIEHDVAAIKRALHDPDLLSPVNPVSPVRPPSPSSTFGNIMTTRKLKHAQSLNFGGAKQNNPYASLGLRVSMPQVRQPINVVQAPRPRTLSTMYGLGLGSRNASGRRVVLPSKNESPPGREDDDIE